MNEDLKNSLFDLLRMTLRPSENDLWYPHYIKAEAIAKAHGFDRK